MVCKTLPMKIHCSFFTIRITTATMNSNILHFGALFSSILDPSSPQLSFLPPFRSTILLNLHPLIPFLSILLRHRFFCPYFIAHAPSILILSPKSCSFFVIFHFALTPLTSLTPTPHLPFPFFAVSSHSTFFFHTDVMLNAFKIWHIYSFGWLMHFRNSLSFVCKLQYFIKYKEPYKNCIGMTLNVSFFYTLCIPFCYCASLFGFCHCKIAKYLEYFSQE